MYSRYAHVLDADGSEMGVRAALELINEELDAYFNDQSDGADAESRFCVELYTQAGFNDVKYGEAEVLATAKNVSNSREWRTTACSMLIGASCTCYRARTSAWTQGPPHLRGCLPSSS